jgi:DNA-binding NarL/FixJ family response regulator
MIRIAIADDEALFRKGMILLLEENEDMKIVVEAKDGQDLLKKLHSMDALPDVLLLDLNMPNLNGPESAKIIRQTMPELNIIILSTYFSKAFIINMIEIGACAYLPKNSVPEDVTKTIREVYKNGFSYDKYVLEVLHESINQRSRSKPLPTFQIELSNRELEVLQLICEEYTTAEIAEKLFLSPRTVDGHRNNLLEKLNCKNVAGLVVYAVQNQIVKINPETFWFKK